MKHIFTILLVLVVSSSFAQVKIEGVVKDSIGNPLELANVIAINQETNKLDSYGITNDQGRYKLSLEKNTSYKVQVSYIGMKTAEVAVTTKEESVTRDFVLENDNTLDEVELIYEMPVTVKGDTLIYNADSFNTGTERKLEDVLKNLPGVEINADGQVEVEGKVVNKVMVEGKDFFDGDSKLATKNIPANAVDKVQVLKNYAEVGQLSGVQNNQDNIALNIKLKEGKDNFWFGNVTGGGGVSAADQALYLAQAKLFYYSKKMSVNVITDANNLGEIAFSRRDYFNFGGGFNRAPSQNNGTNISLGNNGLGFLNLQNDRAKEINSRFGAANFSYSPNDKLDITGFAIYTGNKIELQENNDIQYNDPRPGDVEFERTVSRTTQRSDLGAIKLATTYKKNANNQLDYEILGRMSQETQDQNLFSSVLGGTKQFEETNPFSINQRFNYYYTLNDNNIFAFEAQHLWSDEDPFYNAILVNDPFNNNPIDPNDNLPDGDSFDQTALDLGMNQSQNSYNFSQDKRVKTNQIDAKLDYWNVLNDKSNINFTLGTIYSNQKFNSQIFQTLDSGSIFNNQPQNYSPINDVNYTFTDLYLGVHYRVKIGIATLTPGFTAHAYSAKNNQFNVSYTDNFVRLLPDFNARLQLKKSEQITFNYRMQTQFTDVNQLAEGLVANNYNSFFSGNQELESAIAHNLNLNYYSFNMFNYTNVFGNISYTKNIDRIRTASDFQPGSVIFVGTPFNSAFADESLNAIGRFQRSFGKLRATARGNWTYSKFNQFINGNRSVNENYNQNYRLELRSNFKEAPNFEIGYDYGIQDNDQGSSRTKFYTNSPRIELDALIWKTLTFRTEYQYTNLRNEDESLNSFDFWDASLAYRKDADANWEFELKATNLLNTQSQANTTAGNISVRTTEYFIQPRFVTFRVIYNL